MKELIEVAYLLIGFSALYTWVKLIIWLGDWAGRKVDDRLEGPPWKIR